MGKLCCPARALARMRHWPADAFHLPMIMSVTLASRGGSAATSYAGLDPSFRPLHSIRCGMCAAIVARKALL